LAEAIYPHVTRLLDEAPLEVIVSAAERAAIENIVAPKLIWKNIHWWAQEMHSLKSAWS